MSGSPADPSREKTHKAKISYRMNQHLRESCAWKNTPESLVVLVAQLAFLPARLINCCSLSQTLVVFASWSKIVRNVLVYQDIATWPGLLEAWLALTSVKHHGNPKVLIPLNQRLALTRLRTTGPWAFAFIVMGFRRLQKSSSLPSLIKLSTAVLLSLV